MQIPGHRSELSLDVMNVGSRDYQLSSILLAPVCTCSTEHFHKSSLVCVTNAMLFQSSRPKKTSAYDVGAP